MTVVAMLDDDEGRAFMSFDDDEDVDQDSLEVRSVKCDGPQRRHDVPSHVSLQFQRRWTLNNSDKRVYSSLTLDSSSRITNFRSSFVIMNHTKKNVSVPLGFNFIEIHERDPLIIGI